MQAANWFEVATLEPEWRPVAAKFGRAHLRMQTLADDIVAYFAGDSIRPIVEPRADPYVVDVFLVVVKPPPLDLSVSVGEVLHNLRSALNLALFAVWPDAPDRADYPIHTDEAKFDHDWVKRWRPPLDVEDCLRSLQPFRNAPAGRAKHNVLEILRDLNNRDKHRGLALLPVGIAPQSQPTMLAKPEGLIRTVVTRLKGGNLARRNHAYEVHLRYPNRVPDIGVRLQGTPLALENYFPAHETLARIISSTEVALTRMREFRLQR